MSDTPDERKHRINRLTEADDLALLDELLASPPFEAVHGRVKSVWEGITERVARTTNRPTLTYRLLQDRLNTLIYKFERDEAASARASGESEEIFP